MQGRFPVLARTADGKCVNIRPDKGGIGPVAIACFDNRGLPTYYGER
jgi:hypothetical protein